MDVLDTHRRPLRNLRLSVTDRCNLRCGYCMPEEEYRWLPREQVLSFEEILAVVQAFETLGVDRVRLTGGEPLLRRDLSSLVRMLTAEAGIVEVALTTNGLLLAEQATELLDAGLGRVTVSLDTLDPVRFRRLTRREGLDRVLLGLEAAREAGFTGTKMDSVVIRGENDDELVALVECARSVDAEVRFIEYMDVGGATRWTLDQVVSRREMLERLAAHYGPIEPVNEVSSAPSDRFRLTDGTVFGIISSTTQPFCAACDRSRLTADGMWYLCLYARGGHDVRARLRGGASREELAGFLREAWTVRTDRGAEDRLAAVDRNELVQLEDLRSDPHLEMHTRGG